MRRGWTRIYRKIEGLLDTYTYEAESAAGGTIHFVHPPVGNEPTILPMPSRSSKGSEQYPLKLTDKQREALVHSTRLRRGLKNRIDLSPVGTHIIGFTKKELDEVTEEVEISLAYVPGLYKKQLVAVRDNLDDILDALEEDEAIKLCRTPVPKADRIYQLKITLMGISPPIWRRVRVPDCTLGDLHEVIQTVMGWKDCHTHQFIVNGEYYGPPDPDDLDLGMDTEDEEGLLLGEFIRGGRKVRLRTSMTSGTAGSMRSSSSVSLSGSRRPSIPAALMGNGLARRKMSVVFWGMGTSSKRSPTRSTRTTSR